MKYLVTGGTGFIGHNVVRLLEQQGHECIIIDTETDYGFVPKEELKFLIDSRLARIQTKPRIIDIRDTEHLSTVMRVYKPEAVIHLASFPRQKVVNSNPVLASDVMCNGLINLLELSKQHSIKKFVYISSSMVYGDFGWKISEHDRCRPQGQYGIMKYMGEKLVADYARQGYFDHVIIRPSAVYGEWDVEDRVVSKFMLAALRDDVMRVHGANEVLDFTHVDDTAEGIVLAATNPAAEGIYNITYSQGEPYTLLDAANLIRQIACKGRVEVLDKDKQFPSRSRLNIDRAQQELGYNPKISIKEGFQRYYDWLSQNPILWRR